MKQLVRTVARVALAAAAISACSTQVEPVTVPAILFETAPPARIPGQFAVVLDPTTHALRRQVKSSSSVCAGQTYPLAPAGALESALESALGPMFESLAPNALGTISVWLVSFTPRLSCDVGFWQRRCTSTVELNLGMAIDDGAGGACTEAGAIVGEAYAIALRDVLPAAREEIATSERLAGYAGRARLPLPPVPASPR